MRVVRSVVSPETNTTLRNQRFNFCHIVSSHLPFGSTLVFWWETNQCILSILANSLLLVSSEIEVMANAKLLRTARRSHALHSIAWNQRRPFMYEVLTRN